MAVRVDNGQVQLLTRTGLDRTGKYERALANLNVKTAYIDGRFVRRRRRIAKLAREATYRVTE